MKAKPRPFFKTLDVTMDDVEYLVDVEVTSIENTGIGMYEFWGSVGFDHGVDYAEWVIRRVYDAEGNAFDDEEGAKVIKAIGEDEDAVAQIQEELDEAIHERDDDWEDRGEDDP